MGYTRERWHSGLTYRQTCDQCNTTIQYMDDKLGFRPWFPDGFVYCPTCKKPLRHSEAYSLSEPEPKFVVIETTQNETTQNETTTEETKTEETKTEAPQFCSQCGKAFRDGDNFCSGCGTKRI